MARRKTFEVEALLDQVNKMLALPGLTPDERSTASTILETVLHATGNYKGFRYLDAGDLPEGVAPGIIFDHSEARQHQYPDPTRRRYS